MGRLSSLRSCSMMATSSSNSPALSVGAVLRRSTPTISAALSVRAQCICSTNVAKVRLPAAATLSRSPPLFHVPPRLPLSLLRSPLRRPRLRLLLPLLPPSSVVEGAGVPSHLLPVGARMRLPLARSFAAISTSTTLRSTLLMIWPVSFGSSGVFLAPNGFLIEDHTGTGTGTAVLLPLLVPLPALCRTPMPIDHCLRRWML